MSDMLSDLQNKVDDFKNTLSDVVSRDMTAQDLASLAFAAASLEFVIRGIDKEDTNEVCELLSQVRPVLEAAQAVQKAKS